VAVSGGSEAAALEPGADDANPHRAGLSRAPT